MTEKAGQQKPKCHANGFRTGVWLPAYVGERCGYLGGSVTNLHIQTRIMTRDMGAGQDPKNTSGNICSVNTSSAVYDGSVKELPSRFWPALVPGKLRQRSKARASG